MISVWSSIRLAGRGISLHIAIFIHIVNVISASVSNFMSWGCCCCFCLLDVIGASVSTFIHFIIPFRFVKFGPPYLGTVTAAARAALPSPTSACWVFSCFRNPPSSGMDYRIFNVRT